MKKKLKRVQLIFLIFITGIFWLLNSIRHQSQNCRKDIQILFYTSFFGKKPWDLYPVDESCGLKLEGCKVVYDENLFNQSDVVLFHDRDMPTYEDLLELSRRRSSRQLWVYFSMESPVHSENLIYMDNFFNLSSTYTLNSDVRIPYGQHKRKKDQEKKLKKPIDYFKNKTKSVAWVASNCVHFERNYFVDELIRRGVDVEVSGVCSKYFRKVFTCPSPDCKQKLSQFKFYIAAENTFCEDYITEKYWSNAIDANVVPIVLGGANYSNEQLAIPGSFVNPFDFYSIDTFVNYIKQLEGNSEMYNSYFDWKQSWYVLPSKCPSYVFDLCSRAKTGFKRKTQLSASFAPQQCYQGELKFYEWLKITDVFIA